MKRAVSIFLGIAVLILCLAVAYAKFFAAPKNASNEVSFSYQTFNSQTDEHGNVRPGRRLERKGIVDLATKEYVEIALALRVYQHAGLKNELYGAALDVGVDDTGDNVVDRVLRLDRTFDIASGSDHHGPYQVVTVSADNLKANSGDGRVVYVGVTSQTEQVHGFSGDSYQIGAKFDLHSELMPIIPWATVELVNEPSIGQDGTMMTIGNTQGERVQFFGIGMGEWHDFIPTAIYGRVGEDAFVPLQLLPTQIFEGIELIIGTDGPDVIPPPADMFQYPRVIIGGPGDDVLHGTRRCDIILGGKGDDEIFGNGGHDWLSAGSGDDIITYTGYSVFLEIAPGNNTDIQVP